MCLYEVPLKPNTCFCPLWTELISGGLKVSHRQDLCPDGTLRADQFQFLLLLWSTTVKHLFEKNCFSFFWRKGETFIQYTATLYWRCCQKRYQQNTGINCCHPFTMCITVKLFNESSWSLLKKIVLQNDVTRCFLDDFLFFSDTTKSLWRWREMSTIKTDVMWSFLNCSPAFHTE